MSTFLTFSIVGCAVIVAGFAVWHSIRGYRFSNPLFFAVGAIEALLFLAMFLSVIGHAKGMNAGEPILFWSYFTTTLFIAPLAVFWGIGDKTRWGTGVVSIAMLTIAVLVIRLHQIWLGHG